MSTTNNRIQKKYKYVCTEPVGENFDPEFHPELTPQEMMELGVFDGNYFDGDTDEFPSTWFKRVKKSTSVEKKDQSELNFFGVSASQSLQEWQRKGWIHPQDPRGWFQWYCRYYLGRRTEDDQRQIKRWKAMRRHVAQIKSACHPGDLHCRRRQRQALLHWAYDSRKI